MEIGGFSEILAATFGAAAAGGLTAALRPDLGLRWPGVAAAGAALALAGGVAAALTAPERPLGGWVMLAFLGPLAWIDHRRGALPNPLTYGLIAAGLAAALATGRPVEALAGAGAGFAVFWTLAWAWRRLRGVEALGLGDAKLFAGIGAALGWRALPEAAFVAALAAIAAAAALALAARRAPRAGDQAPFGPALAAGAWAAWAWGPLFP